MSKPWQALHATELSLLLAMVCYVHSMVLLCQPLLSYHSMLLVAFVSVPCCFFIVSSCLEMEKSFPNLYWHHFLFMAAHLTTACESGNQDLAKGNLIFFLGVLFFSLNAIYNLYHKWKVGDQQRKDKSEENVVTVPLLIEISVSFMGNGVAMIGRWFIPRDSFLSLMIGTGILFSIGVVFFCYYLISSAKSRRHDRFLQES
ncbi:hypothetical protein PTKIN_Ptkin17bG0046500 [Pterospermum kingtungense]